MSAAPAARRAGLRSFVAARWRRLAVSFAVLSVFFGNQGFRSLVRNYLELRKLTKEIAALELGAKRNAERLRLLRSGDGAVERLARRELGYVRKGEIEYRFPPPAPEN